MGKSLRPDFLFLSSLCSLCLCGEIVFAHPVPKENHDRIIEVKLTPAAAVVKYHLELDESRAELDLTRLELPKEEFARITTQAAFLRVFLDRMAPILGNNLDARLDGAVLSFVSQGGKRDETVKDHLRCDFTFVAAWQATPGRSHTFTFRESNYEGEDFDRIQLSLAAGPGVKLESVTAPDKPLLERPPLEYRPGDAERVRKVSATFRLVAAAEPPPASKPAAPVISLPGLIGGLLVIMLGVGVLIAWLARRADPFPRGPHRDDEP